MIVSGARAGRGQRRTLDVLSGVFALAWLLPLIAMALTAIKPTAEIYAANFRWLTLRPTFEHFAKAWQAAPFGRYYVNSIVVATSATILVLLIGSMAAFALCPDALSRTAGAPLRRAGHNDDPLPGTC